MVDIKINGEIGALLRRSNMSVTEASKFLDLPKYHIQEALDGVAELESNGLSKLTELWGLIEKRVLETGQIMVAFEKRVNEPRAAYPDQYEWPNKSTERLYLSLLQKQLNYTH